VVEDDDIRGVRLHRGCEFFHLAAANQGGGFRGRARLYCALRDYGACAGSQFGQLIQRFFHLNGTDAPLPGGSSSAARFPLQPDQDSPFTNGVSEWRSQASVESAACTGTAGAETPEVLWDAACELLPYEWDDFCVTTVEIACLKISCS